MRTARDRYQTDPSFRNLVDVLVVQIQQCNYTPSELREAVILASIIERERAMPRPFVVTAEELAFLRGEVWPDDSAERRRRSGWIGEEPPTRSEG